MPAFPVTLFRPTGEAPYLKEEKHCLFCNAVLNTSRWAKKKYCSQACQAKMINKESVDAWLRGDHPGWTGKTIQLRRNIRAYLKQVRGSRCSLCGWDGHHPVDGKSLTEIDHIDGDARNCSIGNLRILCPNCHSMTKTFRNRNKKSYRSRK